MPIGVKANRLAHIPILLEWPMVMVLRENSHNLSSISSDIILYEGEKA